MMTFETHCTFGSSQMAADSDPVRPLSGSGFSGYRSHPHVGGQGVYIRELTRVAFADLGHKVTVISGPPYPELDDGIELIEPCPPLTCSKKKNAFARTSAHSHLASIVPICRNGWRIIPGPSASSIRFGAAGWTEILRRHAHRFDVVHDNQTLATPFLRINDRIPVITTLHHPIEIDRRYALAAGGKWWEKALTHRWYRFVGMQADTSRKLPRMLAVSAAARDSHKEHYGTDPDRVRVAFNGIDHSLFHPDEHTPTRKRPPGHHGQCGCRHQRTGCPHQGARQGRGCTPGSAPAHHRPAARRPRAPGDPVSRSRATRHDKPQSHPSGDRRSVPARTCRGVPRPL